MGNWWVLRKILGDDDIIHGILKTDGQVSGTQTWLIIGVTSWVEEVQMLGSA